MRRPSAAAMRRRTAFSETRETEKRHSTASVPKAVASRMPPTRTPGDTKGMEGSDRAVVALTIFCRTLVVPNRPCARRGPFKPLSNCTFVALVMERGNVSRPLEGVNPIYTPCGRPRARGRGGAGASAAASEHAFAGQGGGGQRHRCAQAAPGEDVAMARVERGPAHERHLTDDG